MRARRAALACVVALLALAPGLRAQAVDRSHPPEIGPPPAFAPPPVHRFALSNGLPVYLVEKHEVPLVQVNLVVRAGAVDEPAGERGLASMTADMLDEGAGGRSALELADAIDYLGVSLETGSGRHTTAVRLHAPLARLEAALPLMADVAIRPDFPAAELARKRKEALTTLLQWHDQPRAIAGVAFTRTLFGDEHPYGPSTLGTEASLKAITVADLKRFHDARFGPANATLVVAGDVTEATVRPLLEKAFGGWSGGSAAPAVVPAAAQVDTTRVILVDKPGAAQSEIYIGRIGVPRTTDDYFPIVVMNTILGGSFTSRLNANLREDKEYTYGAFSVFDFRPSAGPFLALAAVQTDVTAPALTEFMKELRRIREDVTEEEVRRARNYVALGFPQAFQTVAGIAGQEEDLALYGLPDDYYDHYVERVLAVDRDDVLRVAREYVDPARVDVIVVGDLSKVEAGVRALDLGPVRVESVDDVLGPPPEISAD